jgi:nicotinamidase-related amidase
MLDLCEVVYAGGALPPAEIAKSHPNSCGEYAHAAIEPTKQLFAGARAAGLPIFYSTGDTRATSRPSFITATKRNRPPVNSADYAIRPEFKPEPDGAVITKQRASVFFGTPLMAYLTQLGAQSLIVC